MKKKGVTLMAVLTIIIVITILTVTVTFSGINILKEVKTKKFVMQMSSVEEAYARLDEKNEKILTRKPIRVNFKKEMKSQFQGEALKTGVSSTDKYYILYIVDNSELGVDLDIGNLAKGPNDTFAVSAETGRMYYLKGIEVEDKIYYTLTPELRAKIDLKEPKKKNEIKDGILVEKSTNEYTKDPISVNVYIPLNYTNPSVTNKEGITASMVEEKYKGEKYNKFTLNNVTKNINLVINYNGKSTTYYINNIDNISPTIKYEDILKRKVGIREEIYITGVTAKDNESKIVKLKYETEKINEAVAKKYFSSNGIPVRENKIKVGFPENTYTIYAEDEAGNFKVIYVSLEPTDLNAPAIAKGMIPIKHNGTNWVICSDKDKEWYNYDERKWANVMLSDGNPKATTVGTVVEENELGSMFVWIPRFAYSINKYKTVEKGVEGIPQNLINVTILEGNTNTDKNGGKYPTDYNASQVKIGAKTPMIVHPAFHFGGKELNGIWVAKFEASMDSSSNLKIIPKASPLRDKRPINDAFNLSFQMNKPGNIYGLKNNMDTHLMKNVDWGAVAYFAASQYGAVPAKNETSITGGNDYKQNVSQSTTGNITGIYDMNGCSEELVAAFFDNGHKNLIDNCNTCFEKVGTNVKLKTEYEKYWDKYETENDEKGYEKILTKSQSQQVTVNKYNNYMSKHKGDAMYECSRITNPVEDDTIAYFYDDSWYNLTGKNTEGTSTSIYNDDFMVIGNTKAPFMVRGGKMKNNEWAPGIFSQVANIGGSTETYNNSSRGFRPVIKKDDI